MSQGFPKRKQDSTGRESQDAPDRSGRSIDEWLAAAVAEQSRRSEAREPETGARAAEDEAHGLEKEAPSDAPRPTRASGPDSDRRVYETAAKTAAALGSVTSWIERAQEQLAETARASEAAQQHTTAVVTDAIDTIGQRLEDIERKVGHRGSFDALRTVERLDLGTTAEPGAHPGQRAQDEGFRSLESRIREIADRLEAPRPIGRRGLEPQAEVEAAVAEIRARQMQLERPAAPPSAEGGTRPDLKERSELAQRLRADMDRMSRRIAPEAPAQIPGLDNLRREIGDMRTSLGSLATREHLDAVEQSIASLTRDLATRSSDGEVDGAGVQVDALAAEVRRLAEVRDSGELSSKLTRDIDVLSHKLDIIGASGIDPAQIESLSAEVGEVRRLLATVATPSDIAGLSEQISELKLELARIGSRQVDTGDFASLRFAFEEMRDSLRQEGGFGSGDLAGASLALQQAAREEIQPVAGMLATLAEKIDRMERPSTDPDALDQLERQISALTASILETAGRDPALAELSHAMRDLMGEISSWRDGTVEIAERAARNAVAETLGNWRAGDAGENGPARGPTPAPAPTGADLDAVNSRLEDVVRRIGGLDAPIGRGYGSGPDAAPPADRSAPEQPAEARRAEDALLLGAAPEPDRPSQTDSDEILLEPGAERPRAGAAGPVSAPAEAADARDVKASFIAAARRAAQAAAADANRGRTVRPGPQGEPATDTATGQQGRLRSVLDRLRRPLLMSAAALVVAVGGYRLLQESAFEPSEVASLGPARDQGAPPTIGPSGSSPAATQPRTEMPEPQTTQSAPPREDRNLAAGAPGLPLASPAVGERMPDGVAATPEARETAVPSTPMVQAAAPNLAPASPLGSKSETSALPPLGNPSGAPSATAARPTPEGGAAPSTALKQAALAGEPLALYEMAARTLDGRGVARDPRAAVTLFEKAAEKNFAPAQYRVGNAYEKGAGVGRDIEIARKWYLRAAENGNVRAMHNLAVLMAEGGGGKPDYSGAIGWFQRAADHGVKDSQFNLAVLFARGLGTGQDLVKSYTWFAIAAVQGDEEASRKRDEVAGRLSAADLARAKSAAERWQPVPSNAAANEVQAPPAASPSSPDGAKKPGRDGRA